MTDTENPTRATSSTKRSKGKRVALIMTLLVLACGLVWLGYRYLTRNQVSTDDAYIQAHILQVAPRVTGNVAHVFVRDNQPVAKGDPLFSLDPSDLQAALAKANAGLQAAQASYQASQRQLTVTQKTSSADIQRARARLQNAQAEAHRTNTDAQRYRALNKKHEVSEQQLDQATTAAKSASASVREARAQLAQAETAPEQIALKKAQVASAKAKVAQAEAGVKQAQLNLSYTEVRAPHAGRIAKKSIVSGSQVSAGQAAMALVETGPWVVANYKETQLDRVRPGQPVDIEIDAYPDHQFSGRVESIQPGTGVTFSLLPPQNASGNFVKIVQRVPVKIIFSKPDQLKGLIVSPGLSVVPTINVVGNTKPRDRSDIPATENAAAQ